MTNWNFDLTLKLLYDFDAGNQTWDSCISNQEFYNWATLANFYTLNKIISYCHWQTSSHHIAPLGASSSTLLQYWKVLPGLILGCWNQEKIQTQTKHTSREWIFKRERFNCSNEMGTDTYKLFSTTNAFKFVKFKKKNQKDLLCIDIKKYSNVKESYRYFHFKKKSEKSDSAKI